MTTYKQLMNPVIYEKTRQDLFKIWQDDSDELVEKYFGLFHELIECNNPIDDLEFVEIIEFYPRLDAYRQTLTGEELEKLGSYKDGIYAMMMSVELMHKNGYYVPNIILQDLENYKQE